MVKCRNCGGEVDEAAGVYVHLDNGQAACRLNSGLGPVAAPEPYPDPELEAFLAAEAEALRGWLPA